MKNWTHIANIDGEHFFQHNEEKHIATWKRGEGVTRYDDMVQGNSQDFHVAEGKLYFYGDDKDGTIEQYLCYIDPVTDTMHREDFALVLDIAPFNDTISVTGYASLDEIPATLVTMYLDGGEWVLI